MRFQWTEQRIQWFLKASTYTNFHRQLAQYLLPYISNDDRVCDFGCGIGRLSLELAPRVAHLTAVDIDSQVIQLLEQNTNQAGIKNMSLVCQDAEKISEEFDVGIMSFYGQSGENTEFYRSKCKKKLIRIVNMKDNSTLYPGAYRKGGKETAQEVLSQLKASKIPFEFEEIQLEFGQPLVSFEDGVAYIRCNAPDIKEDEIEMFLKKQSIQTNRKDYPLYIPNLKQIGIFIFT